jgi:hypothetical protein
LSKNKNHRNNKEHWSISGRFCPKRNWDEGKSHFFKIDFSALGTGHARKIALERLKAFAKRSRNELGIGKFTLSNVILRNGHRELSLKPNLQNNSILFAKKPHLVFLQREL